MFNNERRQLYLKRASGQHEYCRLPNEHLLRALITVILSMAVQDSWSWYHDSFLLVSFFSFMGEINR